MGMNPDSAQEAWEVSVRDALAHDDTGQLSVLFVGAQEVWGRDRASRMWLEIVSAFDANAVTG
jgi:hypothetical protein